MPVKKQASVKSIKRRSRKSQKVAAGRAKEFRFKGLSLEELQALEFDKLLEIFPSRIRRSLTREFNYEQAKLKEKMEGSETNIKTHVRSFIILPKYVGKVMEVYNGNSYVKFEIRPEMIGHYLGEFAPTRKDVKHSGPGVGATRYFKFMPLK